MCIRDQSSMYQRGYQPLTYLFRKSGANTELEPSKPIAAIMPLRELWYLSCFTAVKEI